MCSMNARVLAPPAGSRTWPPAVQKTMSSSLLGYCGPERQITLPQTVSVFSRSCHVPRNLHFGELGRCPWGLQVHVRNQSCSTSGLLSERQSFGGNAEQRSKAKHVLSTIRSDGHHCGHTRRHVELHNTCSRIGKEGAAPSWSISSWGRTTLVISKSDSR